MSYKSCPDWPALMELAPDLQFKHMTVHDAQLPFEVVAKIPRGVSLDDVHLTRPLPLRSQPDQSGATLPRRAAGGNRLRGKSAFLSTPMPTEIFPHGSAGTTGARFRRERIEQQAPLM